MRRESPEKQNPASTAKDATGAKEKQNLGRKNSRYFPFGISFAPFAVDAGFCFSCDPLRLCGEKLFEALNRTTQSP